MLFLSYFIHFLYGSSTKLHFYIFSKNLEKYNKEQLFLYQEILNFKLWNLNTGVC